MQSLQPVQYEDEHVPQSSQSWFVLLQLARRAHRAFRTFSHSTVPLSIVPLHDAASMPPELPLLLPELPDELPLLDPLLLPELLPLLDDDPASDPLPVEDDDEHAAMLRHPSPATNTTLKRLFLTATSLKMRRP